MKKKRISQIQKQYRFEEENNAYLIEISLDDYDDIYDEWDPAPFKKRFIDEDFNEFIETSAEDIPMPFHIIIVLYIPEEKKNLKKEKSVGLAYENFYLYAAAKEQKNWLSLRKKTILYFLFSMILLAFGYFYMNETENLVYNVVREGIFIGGWVFLWEVITNIFITRSELKSKLKQYKRLYAAEVRFVYI